MTAFDLDHPHAAAMKHLSSADERMAALITRAGPCRIRAHAGMARSGPDLLVSLVEAIVSQQLSSKAADTIFGRVRALVPGALTPEALLALSEDTLRGAGLSGAKTRGVRDLCEHVRRGSLDLDGLHALSDEAVIGALTEVRGIGRWTAEMVLIFQLGRPDVLPVGDLGVQKGFQKLFGLRKLPPPERMVKLARPFQPHRSVMSWYMWRLIEEKPAATTA
ncbi:DNA-3-methyladenine glycosylase II [Minicystis rosea]|nr:DNA-3-methyladenine glycosylase II [Minicystis rosea]